MADKFVCIRSDVLKDSTLENSICSHIFNRSRFSFAPKMKLSTIQTVFGNPKDCLDNFVNTFDVRVEDAYFDLKNKELRTLVISCYGYDERVYYCLVRRLENVERYEMIYLTWDHKSIKTEQYESNLYSKEIMTAFSKIAVNLSVIDVMNALDNIFYDKGDRVLTIDESMVSPFIKDIISIKCMESLDAIRTSDIKIASIAIDLYDLSKPAVLKAFFTYKDKNYVVWTNDWEIEEVKEIKNGDKNISLLSPFADSALKQFEDEYGYIVEDAKNEKLKKTAKELIQSIWAKKLVLIDNGDSLAFKDIGDDFITFGEDITIRNSRDITNKEVTHFSYEEVIDNKLVVRPVIDRYLNTKPIEYVNFMKDADDVLDGDYDLETSLSKINNLLNNVVPSLNNYDKAMPQFEKVFDALKNKRNRLHNVDKAKISKVLGLINKIKDAQTYDKYSDDLGDAIDDLNDEELSAIKHEYDKFLKDFSDVPAYLSQQTIYRRVFIRKSALEDIKTINAEQSDLRILNVLDDVVDTLKTIPGKELGAYLLRKGLNFPIKKDRSIKKIRILRNAKYRLLFVYGSDLDLNDRLENADSIYIFAVTEHKKDNADLYTKADTKPTKYQINDFILYPRNKALKIPECTSEQYKIAATNEERPTITFGCAGSGKTTVSIEKYVNIVYYKYDCKSPKPEDLVYITFHRGLSDKVKKDLLEFKIEGNCFKLDEYFAYVIGEEYVASKTINEIVFINWFNKAYSEAEIKKNKGQKKKKIAPLSEKPDLARLLYTYYRGVFKGSKKLYDTNDNYLPYQTFMSEMSKEEYLSDDEKSAIYNICVEFNDYATANGLLSDNDWALKVIRQVNYGIKRTDCIIIDEVQDLTEIELIATILTLKKDSQKIYFYGDPHQSINPNIFKTNTINMVFTELKKQSVNESEHLKTTYRTNRHLISYLNELLRNRDKWIGLFGGGIQHIEEPNLIDLDTSWAGYVTERDLYTKVFDSIKNNPNGIIITPGEVERQKLLAKYPNVEPERAITIYDAKGMEWETIIMYNMFTSYESYFMDMVLGDDKAKKSTIHRMTFNKYYVGCTRSTKSFVIIEENEKILENHNPIFDTLLSSFAPIYREEQIDTYIFENNTFEAWYREAIQNLENDNTSTFRHAAAHASALATTEQEKKLVRDLLEGNDPDTLEKYAFDFLESGDYDLARNAFYKCYKLANRDGPYITLAFILEGKQPKEKFLKDLLKHKEIIDKYPEVLPKLIKLPDFQNHLRMLIERLKPEEK